MLKNIFVFSLLLIAITFFGSSNAQAATLQVGPGQTYTTIQACANVAAEGDTCLVNAGTYSEIVTPANSGSFGKPITFLGASGTKPIVNGFRPINRNYITITGFEIRGTVSCSTYSGNVCNWLNVSNNMISNGGGIGVQARGDNVLISDNTFTNMSNDAILQFGDRWIIRNNKAISQTEPPGGSIHMDFWQSYCSSNTSGQSASFGLLENNEYIDISGVNTHFALVNSTNGCGDPPTNMIFRYNKIRNIGSAAIYIDNNQQAPGATHNVIYNNTMMDLVAGTPPSWLDFCCTMNASTLSSGINNLFYNAMDSAVAKGFDTTSGWFQSNNLYYDPGATMTFAGAAVSETGAIKNQNPQLANPAGNDFSLQASSPAINAGGRLTSTTNSGSNSTSLQVNDAAFFQDGWAGETPDRIAVGSSGNSSLISSINYATNMINLASSISWNSGDPVYLFAKSDGVQILWGSAPDIGATEYQSGSVTPPPSPPADTTAPTISAIATSSITTTGATITWTTNESSDSQIEYGLTSSYGSQSTLSTSLTTSHSQTLSGLSSGITYHYRVRSKDSVGNLGTSADSTFATIAVVVPPQSTPTPPPSAPSPTPTPTPSGGGSPPPPPPPALTVIPNTTGGGAVSPQPVTLPTTPITPSTPPPTTIPGITLTQTLTVGSKGTQVTTLQNYLISLGYLAQGNNDGNYGPRTQSAVQQYQCKSMNICSGSTTTNGYGMVGIKTRASLAGGGSPQTGLTPAQRAAIQAQINQLLILVQQLVLQLKKLKGL